MNQKAIQIFVLGCIFIGLHGAGFTLNAATTSDESVCTDGAYTVPKKGDRINSLWRVAETHYEGKGHLFLLLAKKNNIKHPYVIHPGQVLIIPDCASKKHVSVATTPPVTIENRTDEINEEMQSMPSPVLSKKSISPKIDSIQPAVMMSRAVSSKSVLVNVQKMRVQKENYRFIKYKLYKRDTKKKQKDSIPFEVNINLSK